MKLLVDTTIHANDIAYKIDLYRELLDRCLDVFFSCIIKTEMRIFTPICTSKPNRYYNTNKTD